MYWITQLNPVEWIATLKNGKLFKKRQLNLVNNLKFEFEISPLIETNKLKWKY